MGDAWNWSTWDNLKEVRFGVDENLLTVEALTPISEMGLVNMNLNKMNKGDLQDVPMWCAFEMEAKRMVKIRIPHWLHANNLQEIVKEERSQDGFTKIPDGYLQIAHHFFTRPNLTMNHMSYPGGSHGMHRSMQLVEELRCIREKKILKGLDTLDADARRININNMTPIEIATWRHSFQISMNCFRKIKTEKRLNVASGQDTANQSTDGGSTTGADGNDTRPSTRGRRTSSGGQSSTLLGRLSTAHPAAAVNGRTSTMTPTSTTTGVDEANNNRPARSSLRRPAVPIPSPANSSSGGSISHLGGRGMTAMSISSLGGGDHVSDQNDGGTPGGAPSVGGGGGGMSTTTNITPASRGGRSMTLEESLLQESPPDMEEANPQPERPVIHRWTSKD